MSKSAKIEIFTDGSSFEGFTGWGFCVYRNKTLFLEAYGPGQKPKYNDHSEALALLRALQYVDNSFFSAFIESKEEDKKLPSIKIKSDATYVINAFSKWVDGWARHNWINNKGKLRANHDIWREVLDIKLKWQKNNFLGCVEISHVKGHSGVEGNELADKLADKGRTLCIGDREGDVYKYTDFSNISEESTDIVRTEEEINKPKFKASNLPGLISGKRLIFRTGTKEAELQFLNSHGIGALYASATYEDKGEDMGMYFGKASSSTHYSVAICSETIPLIEESIAAIDQSVDNHIAPAQLYLDTLFNKNNQKEMYISPECLTVADGMYTIWNNKVLGILFKPAFLSSFGISHLEKLTDKLITIKSYSNKIDITDLLYTYDESKKKFVFNDKLKHKKGVSFTYSRGDKSKAYMLTFGIDLPDVARLVKAGKEHSNIAVNVVITEEEPNSIDHFQFIETDEILAGYYNPHSSHRLFL